VVEHDAALREVLERVLHCAGFAPVTAPTGGEALSLLRCGIPVKVIILDLEMPARDGWAFRCEQRRDPKLSQIPVIVASPSHERMPPGLVADAVLRKPIDLDQLIACLRTLCEAAFA
jgi:chemotaxis family two-component system sensor histidine kinase/response regulator PixL